MNGKGVASFALRFHCLTERNVGTFFHGVPLGCMSHDLMKHRPHFVTSGCISKLGTPKILGK